MVKEFIHMYVSHTWSGKMEMYVKHCHKDVHNNIIHSILNLKTTCPSTSESKIKCDKAEIK